MIMIRFMMVIMMIMMMMMIMRMMMKIIMMTTIMMMIDGDYDNDDGGGGDDDDEEDDDDDDDVAHEIRSSDLYIYLMRCCLNHLPANNTGKPRGTLHLNRARLQSRHPVELLQYGSIVNHRPSSCW